MLKYCCNFLIRPGLTRSSLRPINSGRTVKEKWDLFAAVCVERRPIITAPLNKLEGDYKTLLSQVEFERSLKSDFEQRHEKELKQIEQLKKGDDVEVHLKETAQEFVDACVEELTQFQFPNRLTEADKRGDDRTLNRKLDKHLVFVLKQKIGKDYVYLLPQCLREDEETLRQTAERILKQTCGDELKAIIYGNAPSSFYKYKYPKSLKEERRSVGAKVFIYFARYQKGQLNDASIDFKWLDRTELKTFLPTEYGKSVSQMLIDE